jgi:hypothetical protein
MPQIQIELNKLIPKSDFKEMLTVSQSITGKTYVKINFSSLDIIQTCMRKARFALSSNFSSASEAPALVFGTGVHKALEVWYCAPRENRKHGSVKCDDAHAAMLTGNSFEEHNCARCAAMLAFITATKVLSDTDGARSPESGVNILNNYFDVYLDDPYEILYVDGKPMCEITASAVIYSDDDLEIEFFGTIDSVLRNRETSEVIICDHKTTSSLGKDFFNRIKPNFQYAGYWLLARQALGLDPKQFMVNGIQVAKTKQELSRQFTSISDEEIEELKSSLIWGVRNYLKCEASGIWPMSAPTACSQWGGCQFKKICEMPKAIHQAILEAEFVVKK